MIRRIGLLLVISALPLAARGDETVSYARDVRPILAAKCFACHGPDEHAREADLRLDLREAAVADLGGYQAFKPGDANESESIIRMESGDPDERMPPLDSNKTLSTEEIAILRRWIDQGAKYEQHWAYVAPQRPAAPSVKQEAWPRNPIDYYILARLEAAGLAPSPEADVYTLIRRLYLDLIGLPPTVEEADRWAARLKPNASDAAINEQAYGALVDELLASPHYGERWARKWLDLARYADTNGYEKDRPRDI
ncbi:MAG: DUF1549 domain-containing protein, partial [Planctomycetales bacterium]|nr:DUF1549 domain-containing protein [Planctomycetales bacterium]